MKKALSLFLLIFSLKSFAQVTIDPNTGNVGVKTTTPEEALDINGGLIVRGNILAPKINGIGITNGAGNNASNIFLGGSPAGFSGTDNMTLAYYSCLKLSTGSGNVLFGSNMAQNLTTGNYNIGVGFMALQGVTTGRHNIGIGAETNRNTGSFTVAVGDHALSNGYDNEGSVAVGSYALQLATGKFNTAVGQYAGYDGNTAGVLTGSYNTYLGRYAGQGNLAGSYNTFIGTNSSLGSVNNYVIIADGQSHNRLVIDNNGNSSFNGSVKATGFTISSAPVSSSPGNYQFLTRNPTTGVIETIASTAIQNASNVTTQTVIAETGNFFVNKPYSSSTVPEPLKAGLNWLNENGQVDGQSYVAIGTDPVDGFNYINSRSFANVAALHLNSGNGAHVGIGTSGDSDTQNATLTIFGAVNSSTDLINASLAADPVSFAVKADGSVETKGLKLTSAPAASTSGYDVLTRNSTTGAVETISSSAIQPSINTSNFFTKTAEYIGVANGVDSHITADDYRGNKATFAYSTTKFGGALLSFGGLNGYYDTQINGAYRGDQIAFRSRNGDNSTWSSWRELYHEGNLQKLKSDLALTSVVPETGTITVGGDLDKYYPVSVSDGGWVNHAESVLELGRSGIHENASWRGSIMARFSYHTTTWGHGSAFINASVNTAGELIAGWEDVTQQSDKSEILIWLKGGGTTYHYKANYPLAYKVFDGVANPFPFLTRNGIPKTYKTEKEPYVNSAGLSNSGTAFFTGSGNNYFSGNLGIGTLSPQYKLDVSGTARFTGRVQGTPGVDPGDFVTKAQLDAMSSTPTSSASKLDIDGNNINLTAFQNVLGLKTAAYVNADHAKTPNSVVKRGNWGEVYLEDVFSDRGNGTGYYYFGQQANDRFVAWDGTNYLLGGKGAIGTAALRNVFAGGDVINTVPWISGDGVAEIGRYLDFHTSNNSQLVDYDLRISTDDNGVASFAARGGTSIQGQGSGVNGANTLPTSGDFRVQASTGGRSATQGAQLEFVIPANTDGSNMWGQGRIITVAGNSSNGNAAGKMILGTRRMYNKLGTGAQWYYGDDIIIDQTGHIGIGTDKTSDFLLSVGGSIKAVAVKVDPSSWYDNVFKKDYKLRTLADLEMFVEANQHLPDIPSEAEVKKNGIEVGEMNSLLLKKIEELTLYLIEKDKQLEKANQRIDQLADKVDALSKK